MILQQWVDDGKLIDIGFVGSVDTLREDINLRLINSTSGLWRLKEMIENLRVLPKLQFEIFLGLLKREIVFGGEQILICLLFHFLMFSCFFFFC